VLAPFYDLLATAIYPQLTPKMAMKIGSKYKFSELEARHWEQFAEEAGLAKAATRKRLQQLANELPPPPASCRPRHRMVLRAMPWWSRSCS
jgi:serine/threonine-protein kinase HipA